MTSWDVVVVGAGPAGSIAAHELARRGRSVLLLERSAFPRWKVCGACLSPGAVELLRGMGLGDVPETLGVPLRTFVLRAHGQVVRLPLRGSVALSRGVLDRELAHAATAHGAELWTGARASLGPADRTHRIVRVERAGASSKARARIVIDASGLASRLGDESDGKGRSVPAPGSRLGLGAAFVGRDYPIGFGELHMAIDEPGYAGLVRTEEGTLNVAAAVDPAALRGSSPGVVLGAILQRAGLPPIDETPLQGWKGTPLLTRSRSDVGAARLFRVGDAAGYVEPFTGEGICWAVSAGRTVARLADLGVTRWDEGLRKDWGDYLGKGVVPAQRLCRVLARLTRQQCFVRAAVGALSLAPLLGTPLVRWASRAPWPGREAGA